MSVPESVIRELQEAYTFFVFDGSNKVKSSEVGAVIRSVGLNPTESQLKDIRREVDKTGDGRVSVKELCSIIGPRFKSLITSQSELRDAFQIFDKMGNGSVVVPDMRHSLTNLGERIDNELLDELIREVDQDGEGQMSVNDLVNILLPPNSSVKAQ